MRENHQVLAVNVKNISHMAKSRNQAVTTRLEINGYHCATKPQSRKSLIVLYETH